MNIEQLRYLVEINKCKSITQASENLHISHQALSASIKALERELNVALLTKNSLGSKLTTDGLELLEISSEFIGALNDFISKRQDTKTEISFCVAADYITINNFLATKIATIPTTSIILKPIFLECTEIPAIFSAIATNNADLGFCARFNTSSTENDSIFDFAYNYPSLEYRYVTRLNIYCEVSPIHPLAYLNEIPLNKLHKYALVFYLPRIPLMIKDELAEVSINKSAPFTKFFEQFNFSLETNFAFYLQTLQNDNAIGITVSGNPNKQQNFLQIPLRPEYYFEIFSIKQKKRELPPILNALYKI